MTNTEFNALSKEEQIVAIAQDVIEQIKVSRYYPRTGNYVRYVRLKNVGYEFSSGLDIQSNFEDIESCEVCALGACLMSATKFKNVLKFGEAKGQLYSKNVKDLFMSLFSPEQLLLIENAFENYSDVCYDNYSRLSKTYYDLSRKLDDDTADKIHKFYDSHPTTSERLIAIMNNIINNKGVFIP